MTLSIYRDNIPVKSISIVSEEEAKSLDLNPPSGLASHFLVVTLGLVDHQMIGNRKLILGEYNHVYLFPVDKPDMQPVVERLLRELQLPE